MRISPPRSRPPSVRQPGWVLLLGVLGVACLMIGLIMLAMLQAPAAGSRVIQTSVVFTLTGLVLLSIAWINRRSDAGNKAYYNLRSSQAAILDGAEYDKTKIGSSEHAKAGKLGTPDGEIAESTGE